MNSATKSAFRIDPQLLEAAESVLAKNETLSAFIESALRADACSASLSRVVSHHATRRGGPANTSTL